MLSFRGRAGPGALMVDSWLGSTAALVRVWYGLGLTPATLGAEGVERIGQLFGVVSVKSLKNHWRWVCLHSLRSSEPFGSGAHDLKRIYAFAECAMHPKQYKWQNVWPWEVCHNPAQPCLDESH